MGYSAEGSQDAVAQLQAEELQANAARHGGFRADDLRSVVCSLRRAGPMEEVRHGSQAGQPVREACDETAERACPFARADGQPGGARGGGGCSGSVATSAGGVAAGRVCVRACVRAWLRADGGRWVVVWWSLVRTARGGVMLGRACCARPRQPGGCAGACWSLLGWPHQLVAKADSPPTPCGQAGMEAYGISYCTGPADLHTGLPPWHRAANGGQRRPGFAWSHSGSETDAPFPCDLLRPKPLGNKPQALREGHRGPF